MSAGPACRAAGVQQDHSRLDQNRPVTGIGARRGEGEAVRIGMPGRKKWQPLVRLP
jgi:hypothetical protein